MAYCPRGLLRLGSRNSLFGRTMSAALDAIRLFGGRLISAHPRLTPEGFHFLFSFWLLYDPLNFIFVSPPQVDGMVVTAKPPDHFFRPSVDSSAMGQSKGICG